MANLNKDAWVKDIKDTIERDAAFLARMSDLSEFVGNEYINLPQSGAATQIFKNVSAFPLSVAQRTDTNLQIKMDQYSTQAFLVTDLESANLSYNKRDNIMGQHTRKMTEFIGDTVITNIAPTDPTRQVTAGATVGYSDILAIAKQLDLDLMPKTDRFLELSTEAFYELLQDDDVKRAYANGFAYSTMEGAQVFKLAGITINERPTTGGVLGVAYHKASVGKALGAIDFLVDAGSNGNGNPLYGGIIMSARVWLGAGKLRADNKGIVALVR